MIEQMPSDSTGSSGNGAGVGVGWGVEGQHPSPKRGQWPAQGGDSCLGLSRSFAPLREVCP